MCGLPLSETEPVSPCTPCRMRALLASLPPDVLARVDAAILTQHPLVGVMYVRVQVPGTAVYEGLEAIQLRYAQLRATRPNDFTCAHETYWDQQG